MSGGGGGEGAAIVGAYVCQVILYLFFFSEGEHGAVIVQNFGYDLAFLHYMVVKVSHGVISTVNKSHGLEVWMSRDSMDSEAARLMLADYT